MAKNKEELELIDGEENLVLEEEAAGERPGRREKAEKRAKREKKPGRFGRKIKEVFSELKKVTWPTFKSVVKQTTVVLAVVGVFLVVIFGVDYALALAHKALLTS